MVPPQAVCRSKRLAGFLVRNDFGRIVRHRSGGAVAAAGTFVALAVACSCRRLLFAPQQIRPQRGSEALSAVRGFRLAFRPFPPRSSLLSHSARAFYPNASATVRVGTILRHKARYGSLRAVRRDGARSRSRDRGHPMRTHRSKIRSSRSVRFRRHMRRRRSSVVERVIG